MRISHEIIAVFGSAHPEGPHIDSAHAAGEALAAAGLDLLTGGRTGTMDAALRGFRSRDPQGKAHAVLPEGVAPTGHYDQVVHTNFPAPKALDWNPYSRNLVNAAFAHAAIFVSSSPGTLTEIAWMLRLNKPCVGLGDDLELQAVTSALLAAKVERVATLSIAVSAESAVEYLLGELSSSV